MSRAWAGVLAGFVAGAVMAMGMMAWMAVQGKSVWTNPNLIAVMWTGAPPAAGFSGATVVGFVTHELTSALMGWIAVPFVRDLPPARTVLAGFAYALASYPLVFALVLTWANPLMVAQTSLVPMTLAHTGFGVVLGGVYLWLRSGRRAPARTSAEPAPLTTTP